MNVSFLQVIICLVAGIGVIILLTAKFRVHAFFALMMVFQLLFVWKMMPETKGVALEEVERKLVRSQLGPPAP